jgi:hypothetical protein
LTPPTNSATWKCQWLSHGEDSNGGGKIVALWFVQNEEKETLSTMMDCFKKHNSSW